MTPKGSNSVAERKKVRDLRLRERYFPEAENLVFETAKSGFVPLPIILRKLMRQLSPPQLRVLVYLQTRCSKYFICYPTLEEIAHDLGLGSRRNLTRISVNSNGRSLFPRLQGRARNTSSYTTPFSN